MYQLKITLLELTPPIWRRIVIPDCTLGQLHVQIQVAMGWENYHLHEFRIDGECFGPVIERTDDDVQDENRVRLSDLITMVSKQKTWQYIYDFGDGWEHEIVFEQFVAPDPKQKYPRCLEGERACPPEDCGGPWGFMHLLDTLKKSKRLVREDWPFLRKGWDPSKFDKNAATRLMQRDF